MGEEELTDSVRTWRDIDEPIISSRFTSVPVIKSAKFVIDTVVLNASHNLINAVLVCFLTLLIALTSLLCNNMYHIRTGSNNKSSSTPISNNAIYIFLYLGQCGALVLAIRAVYLCLHLFFLSEERQLPVPVPSAAVFNGSGSSSSCGGASYISSSDHAIDCASNSSSSSSSSSSVSSSSHAALASPAPAVVALAASASVSVASSDYGNAYGNDGDQQQQQKQEQEQFYDYYLSVQKRHLVKKLPVLRELIIRAVVFSGFLTAVLITATFSFIFDTSSSSSSSSSASGIYSGGAFIDEKWIAYIIPAAKVLLVLVICRYAFLHGWSYSALFTIKFALVFFLLYAMKKHYLDNISIASNNNNTTSLNILMLVPLIGMLIGWALVSLWYFIRHWYGYIKMKLFQLEANMCYFLSFFLGIISLELFRRTLILREGTTIESQLRTGVIVNATKDFDLDSIGIDFNTLGLDLSKWTILHCLHISMILALFSVMFYLRAWWIMFNVTIVTILNRNGAQRPIAILRNFSVATTAEVCDVQEEEKDEDDEHLPLWAKSYKASNQSNTTTATTVTISRPIPWKMDENRSFEYSLMLGEVEVGAVYSAAATATATGRGASSHGEFDEYGYVDSKDGLMLSMLHTLYCMQGNHNNNNNNDKDKVMVKDKGKDKESRDLGVCCTCCTCCTSWSSCSCFDGFGNSMRTCTLKQRSDRDRDGGEGAKNSIRREIGHEQWQGQEQEREALEPTESTPMLYTT